MNRIKTIERIFSKRYESAILQKAVSILEKHNILKENDKFTTSLSHGYKSIHIEISIYNEIEDSYDFTSEEIAVLEVNFTDDEIIHCTLWIEIDELYNNIEESFTVPRNAYKNEKVVF